MKTIPTSQGELTRSSISYKNDGGYKTMTVGFASPDWYDDADVQLLGNEICDYIKHSDWGGMGVNPQNADEINITVAGNANGGPITGQCNN